MSRLAIHAGRPLTVSANADDQKQIVGQVGTVTYSNTNASGTVAAGQAIIVRENTTLSVSSERGYVSVLDVAGTVDSAIRSEDNGRVSASDAQVAFGELLAILSNDSGDARLLVLGDSTGNATDEWVYLLAGSLAEKYPRFTVDYRLWDVDGDAYATAVEVQAGTGSNTLTIYNCSVAGWNTVHAQGTGTWATKVTNTAAHAVIVSLGHNDGTGGAVPAHAWYTDLALLTEELARALPMAGIACVAQNPRTIDSDMDARRLQTKRWTRLKGYGLIDVWAAFHESRFPVADLLNEDGIHPNAVGSKVWRDEVLRHFRAPRSVGGQLQRPSSLDDSVGSLLVNGDYSTYHAAVSIGSSGFVEDEFVVHIPAASDETNFCVGAYVTGTPVQASTLLTAICPRTITTGTTSSGTDTITGVVNVADLQVGQRISHADITAGTTITAISGHTVTMSANATGSTSGATITFQANVTMNKAATATGNATIAQAAGFAYWEASNCTVAKDTTNYESLPPGSGGASPATGWSCQLTQTSGSSPAYIRQTVPAALVKGKHLFYSARVRRNADDTQRMRVYSDQIGGTAITGLDVPNGPSGDVFSNALLGFSSNFVWVGNRYFCSPDASSFQVFVYVAAGSDETGAVGQVDRAILRAGPEPGDVRRALA